MALKYDYTDILEVDQDTYSAWTPRVQVIEDASIQQAKLLFHDVTDDSQNLKDYCKYRVLLELNGDQMSASLVNYYNYKLSSLEEAFRYGLN